MTIQDKLYYIFHIILSHTSTFLLKAQEEKWIGKNLDIYIIKGLGWFAKFISGELTNYYWKHKD